MQDVLCKANKPMLEMIRNQAEAMLKVLNTAESNDEREAMKIGLGAIVDTAGGLVKEVKVEEKEGKE